MTKAAPLTVRILSHAVTGTCASPIKAGVDALLSQEGLVLSLQLRLWLWVLGRFCLLRRLEAEDLDRQSVDKTKGV